MAKSGQERSEKSAEKRIEYDEKELRHRLRLGTRQKLDELMSWNDIEEIERGRAEPHSKCVRTRANALISSDSESAPQSAD